MNGLKLGAILLVVAGGVGLSLGRFSFTNDPHNRTFGPYSATSSEPREATLAMWAAAGIMMLGSIVIMTDKRGLRT